MEERRTEEQIIMERLIEDAKNYTSGFEATLDHINMGYIHLFKQLDGIDNDGLLLEMKGLSEKITRIMSEQNG